MKRRFMFFFTALLGLILTSCNAEGFYHFTVVTEGEHELNRDLQGDLVVLGGKAIIPQSIKLDGSAHVLSGSLVLAGEITGDVSFLNGNLTLRPTARVGGDLNLGSESYHLLPAAAIEGRVNTGADVLFPDLPKRQAPRGWELLLRALVSSLSLGFIAVVVARCFPDAVDRVGRAAVDHSLVSGSMGMLAGIVGVSLLVTMAYTILLIPITMLGLFVMALAVLYGWIGLGVSIGRLGVRNLKRPIRSSYSVFFGTFAFMFVMDLVTSIPWIGGLIGLILAMIGLGAVFLTRFGLRRFMPATTDDWVR